MNKQTPVFSSYIVKCYPGDPDLYNTELPCSADSRNTDENRLKLQ